MPWGDQDSQTLQSLVSNVGTILTLLQQNPAPLPTYLFAALPAAAGLAGRMVFCSNGRKTGEGAGAGTGVVAWSDGGNWYTGSGALLAV